MMGSRCSLSRSYPHSVRITHATEFAAVKAAGIRARSGPVLISALSGSRQRLGMVIGRRVGSATERNRIRRIIRELFRTERAAFPQGDCVVIPRDGASALSAESLRMHLREGLARINTKLGQQ